MSHKWVLNNCKHSLKQYISLEKVIPAMVEKKILLDKKTGKKLVKKNDKALFVDLLDQLTVEEFGQFLIVIRSIEEETKERQMMKILSDSMGRLKLEEDSNVQKIVLEFRKAADRDVDISSPTSIDSKYPYPSGFLSGCKSQTFTKEGGMLYSPEHGVTVIIPEGAVPASVEKFMLGVYIYMRGPFSIPQNTHLCSPIVWCHHQPRFTFEADVTIKIPHCAVVSLQPCGPTSIKDDDSLSVVTVEDGMSEGVTPFALTRQLKANFSDGYHAEFVVRHFCPYGVIKYQDEQQSSEGKCLGSNKSSGVKKRRQSIDSTANHLPFKPGQTTTKNLQKSVSLQDGEGELYHVKHSESRKAGGVYARGGMNFCITRCMPVDRSTRNWDVNFLISHWHPTEIRVSLVH